MRPSDKKGLVIGLAAIGAAIATELSKPAEERTWHGTIVGVVPYDFRRPTADSVRQKLWNPTGNFWSPSVFGVGWTPNLGRLAAQTGLLGPAETPAAASPTPAEVAPPAAEAPPAPEIDDPSSSGEDTDQ
jgi:hypothetical protein